MYRLLFFFTVSGLLMSVVKAEPYLAFRTGFKCSTCHVNKTGGGKRTGFGFVYAQSILPAARIPAKKGKSHFLDRMINDNMSLGANFRLGNKSVIGTSETREPTEKKLDNSIIVPEANIYLEVEAIPGILSFYMDESFGPSGASSRESVGIIQGLPWGGYLKFGRFMLPYGIRLLDDNAYTRSRTGFNYANQDFGYEIGFEPGPLSLAVSMANGTQSDSDDNALKQITSVGYYARRHWRLGGSFSYNSGVSSIQTMYGGFAGLNLGRLTLMGEYDIISNTAVADDEEVIEDQPDYGHEISALLGVDFMIARGVNFKWAYNFNDPRSQWEQDERDRHIIGLEIFPISFLQASFFYEYITSVPQKPSDNEDRLYLELHFFF